MHMCTGEALAQHLVKLVDAGFLLLMLSLIYHVELVTLHACGQWSRQFEGEARGTSMK